MSPTDRIAQLEAENAELRARLAQIVALVDEELSRAHQQAHEPVADHREIPRDFPRETPKRAAAVVMAAADYDEDVFYALRALGCNPHEAKRLAGIAEGDTPEARIRNALTRR